MAAEIEILVQLIDGKEELTAYLGRNGKFVGRFETLDQYFYDPAREGLQPDRDGRLYQALRLRKKGDQIYVTYKNDNFDEAGKWTYSDEFETSVKDGEIISEIFRHLGFRRLTTIDMTKDIYRVQDFEVVIEDVRNLGTYLEIEFKGPADTDPRVAKEQITDFLAALPIQYTRDFDGGKPELMVQKNGIEERELSNLSS